MTFSQQLFMPKKPGSKTFIFGESNGGCGQRREITILFTGIRRKHFLTNRVDNFGEEL